MMCAAAVGHRSGRATPSLRDAPQQQSMEIVGRETIYRNRNAVQTNPATSASLDPVRRGRDWFQVHPGLALCANDDETKYPVKFRLRAT